MRNAIVLPLGLDAGALEGRTSGDARRTALAALRVRMAQPGPGAA